MFSDSRTGLLIHRLEIFQAEDRDGNTTPLSEEEIANLQVVSLNVKKRPGANILDTVDLIDEKLEAFVFPRGTEFVITGDVSFYVEAMVKDLENNIISGLIFVIAVLLFFLGLRNAVLVGIAIPLSMFISFILLQSLGYTLNFIILFSLIIALGMLVDNAIVIVENIYRYREQGYSRLRPHAWERQKWVELLLHLLRLPSLPLLLCYSGRESLASL